MNRRLATIGFKSLKLTLAEIRDLARDGWVALGEEGRTLTGVLLVVAGALLGVWLWGA